jgi:DNA-binding beta-propeller fold protein YncE
MTAYKQVAWVVTAALLGCGDDSSNAFDQDSASAETTSASTTTDATSSSASASASADTTTSETSSTGTPADTTGEPIFDVGMGDTDVGDGCGCEYEYIWIANADQGTVSKINTRTLEEEGRYITRPDGVGNPSRTSVSLSGDVAVANRHGGLVKFYADTSKCVESNGMPGIQTSSGANNVLGWDVEECRAWYVEFPTTNQRPVAWTPGTLSKDDCTAEGERVWTVMSATPGFAPGTGGAGGVIATLLEGDTGEIVQSVAVDDFPGIQLGAYGGAVDAEGNLFFTPMGGVSFNNQLARIDIDDYTITLWPVPAGIAPYGITVDHDGNPWVSSVLGSTAARFDIATETWEPIMAGAMSLGGIVEGPGNLMWVAIDGGARSIDMDTLMPGPSFVNGGTVKGVSIDVDGYLWAVDGAAHKVDSATGALIDSYNGLTGPYTYSDMTGHALSNTYCPPAG